MQIPAKKDISLQDLSVSPSLYQGEQANLSVMVASDMVQKAMIRISLNNKEIIKQSVAVKKGTNTFSFSHTVQENWYASV